VGDDLEQIAACAVDLGERDERAPQVVTAALAQAELGEVECERAVGVVGRADRELAGRDDQIICGWHAVEHPRPAVATPRREHVGQGRVNRDLARDAGLGSLARIRTSHRQPPERLGRGVVVAPA